jgi:hypothetical protein
MRALALLLALSVPAPVLTVGATPNHDGSVTVFWTLPADPAVTGVTVFRERLDVFEPVVEFTLGLDTSLTDFNTVVTGHYRYGVHTRDDAGRLSDGAFVEVIGSGHGSGSVAVVSTSSGFWCWASAAPAGSAWPLSVALLLLHLALIPRIER